MMLAENELPLLKDQQPPLLEIQFLCLCVSLCQTECLSQRLKAGGHTSEDISKHLFRVRKYLAEKISDRAKTVVSIFLTIPKVTPLSLNGQLS